MSEDERRPGRYEPEEGTALPRRMARPTWESGPYIFSHHGRLKPEAMEAGPEMPWSVVEALGGLDQLAADPRVVAAEADALRERRAAGYWRERAAGSGAGAESVALAECRRALREWRERAESAERELGELVAVLEKGAARGE